VGGSAAQTGGHPVFQRKHCLYGLLDACFADKSRSNPLFCFFHRLGVPCVFDEVTAPMLARRFSPRVTIRAQSVGYCNYLVESGLGVSVVPGRTRSLAQKSVAFRFARQTLDPLMRSVAPRYRYIDNPALQESVLVSRVGRGSRRRRKRTWGAAGQFRALPHPRPG
jgi:hypothetical protein